MNQPKLSEQQNVINLDAPLQLKTAEIRFSAAVASHCPILASDHLGELFQSNVCENSKCKNSMKNFSVHRTKCAALIKNVIAKAIKEELKNALCGQAYSILIDEWSDIDVRPQLGVVCMYYSDESCSFVSQFLGLISLESSNADGIFEKLSAVLKDYGLEWEKLVGFGSDGASVVSGRNNSVWTRIKSKSPEAIHLTCICHSLNLVAEVAFNELPSRLSALLKMVPKWFKNSFKRKEQYNELFRAFESCSSTEIKSNPFNSISTTRWLCRERVIKGILENWIVLREYFESMLSELKNDQKFTANLIVEILRDEENYKILKVVYPVISLLESKNQLFQKDYINPLSAVEELDFLQKSFETRLLDYQGNELPIEKVDFGYECNSLNLSMNSKIRIQNFLQTTLREVTKRCQNSKDKIRSIGFAGQRHVLSIQSKPLFSSFPDNFLKTHDAEQEYRLLSAENWQERAASDIYELSVIEFWSFVKNNPRFKNIGTYMLSLLNIPISNASVERIFSMAGALKSKSRNRMLISTVESIILIKTFFNLHDTCCTDFEVTDRMLSLFTGSMYAKN